MYMPLMVSIHKVVLFANNTTKGIGLQKLRALQPFIDSTEELQIVALDPQKKVEWGEFLLTGSKADLTVSCLCRDDLNQSLLNFCEEHGILCNVVDQKEYCNTWFMGVAQTPNLVLGLSSKGNCPYYTARLRRELQGHIEQCEPTVALLSECRRRLQDLHMGGRLLHRAMYTLHHCQAFQVALEKFRELKDLGKLRELQAAETSLEKITDRLLEEFFQMTDFLAEIN